MKKHQSAKTKSKALKPIHAPQPDAAGIDIGANEIWVALPPDRSQDSVKRFGAFTRDLQAIVRWLLDCGVRSIAMEATGVYWIPLYRKRPVKPILNDRERRLEAERHGKRASQKSAGPAKPGRDSGVNRELSTKWAKATGVLSATRHRVEHSAKLPATGAS
jgi:hypothetical protein